MLHYINTTNCISSQKSSHSEFQWRKINLKMTVIWVIWFLKYKKCLCNIYKLRRVKCSERQKCSFTKYFKCWKWLVVTQKVADRFNWVLGQTKTVCCDPNINKDKYSCSMTFIDRAVDALVFSPWVHINLCEDVVALVVKKNTKNVFFCWKLNNFI